MSPRRGVAPQRLADARDRVFGLSAFRPGQEEAIEAILSGRDLLAVMPTGAGKSLCFQLPAVVHPGLTLVISPLIALMKDQVDALRALGVAASHLSSGQAPEERRAVLADLHAGEIDLLYVSPERLRERAFARLLDDLDVWLVAVDEAHCISAWGTDFRPDYLRIPDAIDRLPSRPVVAAFTATATPEVRADLAEKLRLQQPAQVLAGFDRPNIRFLVKFCRTPGARLNELSREVKRRPGSGIIYAGTRKASEEQAEWLRADGRSALAYHAGLAPEERRQTQEAFLQGRVDIICATNAFGLGIDKSDVRFVIHTSLPASPDAYYQEAGRAGRDGQPADALLMYCRSDRGLQEWLIDNDLPAVNDLVRLHRVVASSDGSLDLDEASAAFDSPTRMRVGLQALAESGLVDLGDRAGSEQAVSSRVEEITPNHTRALEASLARQRARRLDHLEEMVAYAEGSTCRREALLRYFGDPAAAPGGSANCCDRCARPDVRSPGQSADLEKARKLLKPKRLSAARVRVRDALAEHGDVRKAARELDMPFKDVGELARKFVTEGHLSVDLMVPPGVQSELAGACRQMDEAGIDYRRPRPGYLQTAMRFCPDGTRWDHLALYLAGLRRREAIAALDENAVETVRQEEPGRRSRQTASANGKPSWEESLDLFQNGHSIEEIADERGFKKMTIENHLAKAVGEGKLNIDVLVDPATIAIVRQAIDETSESETPLRDIRARAEALAGREIPYLAVNAVRVAGDTDSSPPSGELQQLRERKATADRLRAEYRAAGKPWPESWEAEYRRILNRIAELEQ